MICVKTRVVLNLGFSLMASLFSGCWAGLLGSSGVLCRAPGTAPPHLAWADSVCLQPVGSSTEWMRGLWYCVEGVSDTERAGKVSQSHFKNWVGIMQAKKRGSSSSHRKCICEYCRWAEQGSVVWTMETNLGWLWWGDEGYCGWLSLWLLLISSTALKIEVPESGNLGSHSIPALASLWIWSL